MFWHSTSLTSSYTLTQTNSNPKAANIAMAPLVFLVSAASSGFGKGIALEALKQGHKVIATARNSSKIADLKDKGAVTLDLDVTQPIDELKAIVDKAQQVYGRIDVLINAAGYILEGAIEEAT